MYMKNKVCLVTGGNAGIGKATALGLAKLGAIVVLVCRNKSEGEKTIQTISEVSQTSGHKLLNADLSDFDSIRRCANDFKKQFNRLDVLINNAGAFYTKRQYTRNNVEMQFSVNHLAPFLLTNLLLEVLLKCDNARIINVTSFSHYFGKIFFDDLFFEKKYNGLRAYEQSKLANVLFTYELARKLKDTGVTVNCVDPGRVNTHIGNKNASGIYKFLWILNKPLLISPERGAETSIYLASSKEVDGITGKYFYKCKLKRSSKRSYDETMAKRLWKVSSEFTCLE